MKRFKMNLAILAVLFGTGAAFASTHKAANFNQVLWGQKQNGTWVQTTPGAHCTSASQVCKEDFPSGQDPNVDQSGGTIVTSNGYIN
jgi:hypothetical protein